MEVTSGNVSPPLIKEATVSDFEPATAEVPTMAPALSAADYLGSGPESILQDVCSYSPVMGQWQPDGKFQREEKNTEEVSTTVKIPESACIRWVIKNFSSFRNAAKTSNLPPLRSPEVAQYGVYMLLSPYAKDGHIQGRIVIPDLWKMRDVTFCITITIENPESSAKLREIKVTIPVSRTQPFPEKKTIINLSKATWSRSKRYQDILVYDRLCLVMLVDIYPHNADVFLGFPKSLSYAAKGLEDTQTCLQELLSDIRDFTSITPTQNISISCQGRQTAAVRFLLAARSRRCRVMLSDANQSWQSLEIHDLTYAILEQLLAYVHTCSCSYLEENVPDDYLLELLVAAESYAIPGLIARCCACLTARMDKSNVCRIWDVAKTCSSAQSLGQACRKFLDDLPGSDVADLVRAYIAVAVSEPHSPRLTGSRPKTDPSCHTDGETFAVKSPFKDFHAQTAQL